MARANILAQKKDEEWEWNVSPILERILVSPIASQDFKMQINVALGQWHYKHNQLDIALAYYKKADENALDNILLEHMLTAYIQQKEWDASAGLIERKNNHTTPLRRLAFIKATYDFSHLSSYRVAAYENNDIIPGSVKYTSSSKSTPSKSVVNWWRLSSDNKTVNITNCFY